jgi:hypothetical protein
MRAVVKRPLLVLATAGSLIASLSLVGLPQAHGAGVQALVSTGSPQTTHPQNAQNEPALAVDPLHPSTLVAGANDLVDMQPCSRDASINHAACSYPLGTFNLGVGLQGVYFSFDRGHNWVQPTYRGLTAAGCDPTADSPTSPCQAAVGPIHTVPNFYENGLRSRSDPGVAFGPKPAADGTFSWSNGTRLYYSTLATNLTDTTIGTDGQNTTTGVVVSHFDDLSASNYQDQSRWSRPFFVDKNVGPTAGLDKEQVWADNAATSDFFGNVYVCYTDFHSFSGGNNFPLKPMVAVSRDGGMTWTSRQVAPPTTATPTGSHQGCTVRTDSHGVVYVFFTHFFAGTPGQGFHQMIKSVDGGRSWGSPQDVLPMNDACYFVEPIENRCVYDGVAGARTDLAAMPSVDIANGAPTGEDATNEIVDAWSDGRDGLNHEKTLFSYSTDGGTTWSTPTAISNPADRSAYSAPAIAPDGSRVYVVYQAVSAPIDETSTATPRPEFGVLLSAPIPDATTGTPGAWTTDFSGPTGDLRGTSQGRLLYNEFFGDYVYAIATRDYGAGVWTDTQRTADCPAMDAWRKASFDAGHRVFPAPWPLGGVGDCPPNFGNNDIFSATTG